MKFFHDFSFLFAILFLNSTFIKLTLALLPNEQHLTVFSTCLLVLFVLILQLNDGRWLVYLSQRLELDVLSHGSWVMQNYVSEVVLKEESVEPWFLFIPDVSQYA